ncbi:Alpha-1,2-mannosyltransferase [Penicillium ucsense]|uniref:Alpha-1,2-mannosyltransferase n=1 Tax=Penicillium ucsense TaxID=2839758 RepID=A0A8J8W946_9EURO|nr:Alpha-1,2-mannosyltransferase [Penicillium ucsense]KAF7737815.1 Alpha-1,2-mannosyltransferase [Penicillium ucsense]
MAIPRQYLRLRTVLFAVILTAGVVWFVSNWPSKIAIPHAFGHGSLDPFTGPATSQPLDLAKSQQLFWQQLHELVERHGPQAMPIVEYEKAPTEGFDPEDSQPLQNYLTVDSDDVSGIKIAHARFLAALADDPLASRVPYRPGTRGIVSTAGGAYLPVLVISLRMLRRTGSTLPMEVFLADEGEYEQEICDQVLPELNAQCVVLSQILTASPAKIEKYQFKPFAMLFSSFEEILFLDADAFPLQKPDQLLFDTEPFRTTGLVTWPDFWRLSVSPLFYEITGVEAPLRNLRQSTESGEVLLSKKTHGQTLLLVTYYNYWGPGYYYPLLSQGAAGEGDKETFVAAATVLQAPFYQVSERLVALGHRKSKEGGLAGSAMAQFNPVEDYQLHENGQSRLRGDEATQPGVFFIHANFPKFNPATIFDKHEVNPAFTDEGDYTRAWTIPEDVVGRYSENEDVEKAFWSEVKWTACELEDKFVTWRDRPRGSVCDGVVKYWQHVFE